MAYRITRVGVILALAVCSAGVWAAMRSPTALFPVSGATDITMIVPSWNTWQISYDTVADADQQLAAQGWSADERQYGPLGRAYTRSSSFGVGELCEWAFVRRDPFKPQIAHLRIRRWLEFSWSKA